MNSRQRVGLLHRELPDHCHDIGHVGSRSHLVGVLLFIEFRNPFARPVRSHVDLVADIHHSSAGVSQRRYESELTVNS